MIVMARLSCDDDGYGDGNAGDDGADDDNYDAEDNDEVFEVTNLGWRFYKQFRSPHQMTLFQPHLNLDYM